MKNLRLLASQGSGNKVSTFASDDQLIERVAQMLTSGQIVVAIPNRRLRRPPNLLPDRAPPPQQAPASKPSEPPEDSPTLTNNDAAAQAEALKAAAAGRKAFCEECERLKEGASAKKQANAPAKDTPEKSAAPVDADANPCPADFVINAPCRILKVSGGAVQMSATELPGVAAGTYAWTTTSAKIRLTNANTSTVTVTPQANPSASREAEIITVTRSAAGCPDVVKTVNLTVAKVTFSASAAQRFGYDNFDTPADPLDDHICTKKSDHTFLAVVIAGGALGTDFDFVCDDPAICTAVAPGGTASFDLRLDGGPPTSDHTTLRAKVKCPSAESFAHIDVRVYKEKVVEVVVAKVYDSTVAGTTLSFATADYASHAPTANAKLKEAVVKFNITNYAAANATTDVHYDLDGNAALSFDIGRDGGAELDAIKRAITGTGTKVRVAMIRNLRSFYYLSAAAAIGDRTITVTAGRVFDTRTTLILGTGAAAENVNIARIAGSTITLTAALTKAHARGVSLEYMAGGWSTDPILITEGSQSLLTLKWTVLHEVGHRALALDDINDQTDFMHYNQGWTDYRLRYCPRSKYRGGGTENQWETIPR